MALTKYAAPKPQRVKLPMVQVPVGGGNVLEPKPVAANFYTAPQSTGLPDPVTPRATSASPSGTFDPSAFAASLGAIAPADTNYTDLLANDPALQLQLDAIKAQGEADLSRTTNLQNRAYSLFGSVPSYDANTSNLIGATNVDDLTRQLAAEATAGGVSTVAVRDKSLVDARQSYLASLASRNMIQSGAVGQHENEVTAAWAQGSYQDRQQLADYLISLHDDYLNSLANGNTAKAQATQEALTRIIQQIAADTARRQAEAAAKQAAYLEDLRTNAYGLNGNNPYADFRYTPQPGDATITGGGGGGGGGGTRTPYTQPFTAAEIQAINQSPNALQYLGSDAAQGGWGSPAPPNALQYIGSDAAQGGWSDPARSTQDVAPTDYTWGQMGDQPLYDPYYNPDPVIPQADYSQVDPNLLAIGSYGGYKQGMYD